MNAIISRLVLATAFLLVPQLLSPATGFARDPEERYSIYGYQYLDYLDGRHEEAWLVRDSLRGEIRAAPTAEMKDHVSPAAWQSLIIRQSRTWGENVTHIRFNLTSYAAQYRSRFKTAVSKYINRNRGTNECIRITLDDEIFDPSFNAGAGSQVLGLGDGVNSIIITEDDASFEALQVGVGAMAKLHYDRSEKIVSGRLQTEWKVIEADVHFRTRKMTEDLSSQYQVIVHEMGHAVGFTHTLFPEDYMSYNRDAVNLKTLKKKNRTIKERDRLFFDEDYQKIPRLLIGDAIDLELGTAPDPNDTHVNMSLHQPFAVTTLKGYPGEPLTINIYRGKKPKKNRLIATMTGESIDYVNTRNGTKSYYKYRLSILNIGSSDVYDDLVGALNAKGRPNTINGVHYDKALKIYMEAIGRIYKGGKLFTIGSKSYLVKTPR